MITIYGNDFSTPCTKVRFVANALKLDYEYRKLDLMKGEQKTESYLKLHPAGKVPVLQDGDFTVFESNSIIRYLAQKNSSSLYPQDLKQQTIVNEWMDFASIHIAIPMGKILFNRVIYKFLNAEVDPRSLADGIQFLQNSLPVLEKQIAKNGNIAGAELSLADFSLLAALDPAEAAGVDLAAYPALSAWRKDLMSKDFYQKCYASYGAMLQSLTQK